MKLNRVELFIVVLIIYCSWFHELRKICTGCEVQLPYSQGCCWCCYCHYAVWYTGKWEDSCCFTFVHFIFNSFLSTEASTIQSNFGSVGVYLDRVSQRGFFIWTERKSHLKSLMWIKWESKTQLSWKGSYLPILKPLIKWHPNWYHM